MTTPRVEVITSVERRRRWSREEKKRLVAASFEPGGTAAPAPQMPAPSPERLARRRRKGGIIEIELGGGCRVRVERDVDVAVLRLVLDVLGQR